MELTLCHSIYKVICVKISLLFYCFVNQMSFVQSLIQRSFLWAVLVVFSSSVFADFVFAPLPMENKRQTILKAKEFTNALSHLLNEPVITRYYQSYHEILSAFQQGDIDLVELGPFNYLKLTQRTEHQQPLLFVRQLKHQKFYQCHLVAPIDGVDSLAEFKTLRGAKIALTQPLSTCGWFGMDFFFQEFGLDLRSFDYEFLGSHEEVALQVLRQEYRIGSVANYISERYEGLGLDVIARSPELPLFVLAANPDKFSSTQLHAVKVYLSGLSNAERADWGTGRYGFAPFSDELFDKFEDLVSKMHAQPELP